MLAADVGPCWLYVARLEATWHRQ